MAVTRIGNVHKLTALTDVVPFKALVRKIVWTGAAIASGDTLVLTDGSTAANEVFRITANGIDFTYTQDMMENALPVDSLYVTTMGSGATVHGILLVYVE